MRISPSLRLAPVIFPMLVAPVAADEVSDASKEMEACYLANATFYGAASCQPPPSVVGAVFGACLPEERTFSAAVSRAHPNDPEIAHTVLTKIHAGMTTRIENWVLDTQIKIRQCP